MNKAGLDKPRELLACKCCGLQKSDVKYRGPQIVRNGPLGNAICDDCWDDPSATFAECRHGGQSA